MVAVVGVAEQEVRGVGSPVLLQATLARLARKEAVTIVAAKDIPTGRWWRANTYQTARPQIQADSGSAKVLPYTG